MFGTEADLQRSAQSLDYIFFTETCKRNMSVKFIKRNNKSILKIFEKLEISIVVSGQLSEPQDVVMIFVNFFHIHFSD